MTQRDVDWALVDIIEYHYRWPGSDNEDAVYGFTHSLEVNAIRADTLPPHVITPVEKSNLERALREYEARKNISADDSSKIRGWLEELPDEIAIIEREPFPFG